MQKAKEHKDVLIEALYDYRKWFVEEAFDGDKDCKIKIEEIDNAIDFIKNL